MQHNGYGLERFVYELYSDMGYRNLRKDIYFSKKNGHDISAQIDMIYENALGLPVYVECKSHKNNNVGFEQYAKFVQILNLLRVPKYPIIYRGELITDSYFDKRTKTAAEIDRIKLIDIDELTDLSNQRLSLLGSIKLIIRAKNIYKQKGISGILSHGIKLFLPTKQQIKSYNKPK